MIITIYQPLEQNDIRLLVLERGSGDDEIQCHLIYAPLWGEKPNDDAHCYEALSYKWGLQAGNDPDIFFQGVYQ